ncbi:OLC1v1033553C1 [Oldenlandia corymbosa var. corymbosa]|uniref:OLC1v1033553C1 n=1 Tax=Oldenlandia corymbosa var. corymbosa TaxID=529605 RepID=A0AAV1CRP5_OLDCO|nr:OLC1v1033553C1 [Oldenlandia corymbosa var. corymbosa]
MAFILSGKTLRRLQKELTLPSSEILPPNPAKFNLPDPSPNGIFCFSGENVSDWLDIMEWFFYYNSTPPELKLFTASFYLSGEPLCFLYGSISASLLSTWDEFAEKLELRFGKFIRQPLVVNVWEASDEDGSATEFEDFSVEKEEQLPVEEISGHKVDTESLEPYATTHIMEVSHLELTGYLPDSQNRLEVEFETDDGGNECTVEGVSVEHFVYSDGLILSDDVGMMPLGDTLLAKFDFNQDGKMTPSDFVLEVNDTVLEYGVELNGVDSTGNHRNLVVIEPGGITAETEIVTSNVACSEPANDSKVFKKITPKPVRMMPLTDTALVKLDSYTVDVIIEDEIVYSEEFNVLEEVVSVKWNVKPGFYGFYAREMGTNHKERTMEMDHSGTEFITCVMNRNYLSLLAIDFGRKIAWLVIEVVFYLPDLAESVLNDEFASDFKKRMKASCVGDCCLVETNVLLKIGAENELSVLKMFQSKVKVDPELLYSVTKRNPPSTCVIELLGSGKPYKLAKSSSLSMPLVDKAIADENFVLNYDINDNCAGLSRHNNREFFSSSFLIDPGGIENHFSTLSSIGSEIEQYGDLSLSVLVLGNLVKHKDPCSGVVGNQVLILASFHHTTKTKVTEPESRPNPGGSYWLKNGGNWTKAARTKHLGAETAGSSSNEARNNEDLHPSWVENVTLFRGGTSVGEGCLARLGSCC